MGHVKDQSIPDDFDFPEPSQQPLDQRPTAVRGSQLVVGSSHATEMEMKLILAALQSPPKTADLGATVTAVVSTVGIIVQACLGLSAHPIVSPLMLGLACVAGTVAVVRHHEHKNKKDETQRLAIECAQKLLRNAERMERMEDESVPLLPPKT